MAYLMTPYPPLVAYGFMIVMYVFFYLMSPVPQEGTRYFRIHRAIFNRDMIVISWMLFIIYVMTEFLVSKTN